VKRDRVAQWGTGPKRKVSLRAIIEHSYLDRAVVEIYTDWKVGRNAGDLCKDHAADFVDTAALCECMDLIISVDTSLLHLAGALGKPTWALLPFISDWRWFLDRESSPWYPHAKLYRQSAIGDWDGVLTRVANDLRKRFSTSG
jgi:hypothetical protein